MPVVAVVVAIVGVLLSFAALGWWSATAAAVGLEDQQLRRCGTAPNCVCSEFPTGASDGHYIAPLSLTAGDADRVWQRAQHAIGELGGRIESAQATYLHATFSSRLFRFVDDVELRRDGEHLHMRSASRVGYSDFGVNRKRLQRLQALIVAAQSDDAAR